MENSKTIEVLFFDSCESFIKKVQKLCAECGLEFAQKSNNRVIGVTSRDDVERYAKESLEQGYENSLIITGANAFSYVTFEGESYIAEAWKNKIFTYEINPMLLGFNKNDNKEDVEIIFNTALMLYISKITPSIEAGVKLAQEKYNLS